MAKRYFRWLERGCDDLPPQWHEMSGAEFYQFIHSREGADRYFISWEDLTLEVTPREYTQYCSEKNHADYLRRCANGIKELSLYTDFEETGRNGEDVVADSSPPVEDEALHRELLLRLSTALTRLEAKERWLVERLYLSEPPATLRELSKEGGIAFMTLQNRKKKILGKLRKLLK